MTAWQSNPKSFFQRPSGKLVAQEILEAVTLKPKVAQNILTQLGVLKTKMPGLDPSLILALAYRESGSRILSVSSALIQTDRLSGNGGLAELGHYMDTVKKYVLPEYGENWSVHDRDDDPPDAGAGLVMTAGDGNVGQVPGKELIAAYGATLAMNVDGLEKSALAAGFSRADLAALTPEARKTWQALFFAMPNGASYAAFKASSNYASVGGRTLIQQTRDMITHGNATDLNAILTNSAFDIYLNVRLAKEVAANASVLESLTGLH